jgi:hypothetical protein
METENTKETDNTERQARDSSQEITGRESSLDVGPDMKI